MNDHVISALTKKRAELLGKISYYKQEIKSLNDSLSHIDKTIKIFDPCLKLSNKGKAHRKYNKYFKHGELSKLVLDALRESKQPLLLDEIIDRIIKIKGNSISLVSIRNCLNNQLKKGIVDNFNGTGNEKRWAVV